MDYDKQRAEIDAMLGTAFEAAEAFATMAWPDVPSLIDDLRAMRASPAEYVAKHAEWFRRRGLDPAEEELDWDVVDVVPWGYLIECLGVRGMVALVGASQPAADVAAILKQSAVGPTQGRAWAEVGEGEDALTGAAFLRVAGERLRRTVDLTLVQLHDPWGDDVAVAAVPVAALATLKALAIAADTMGRGMGEF